jgi:hypothetical protein
MITLTTLYTLSVVAGWLWLTFEAFEYLAGVE